MVNFEDMSYSTLQHAIKSKFDVDLPDEKPNEPEEKTWIDAVRETADLAYCDVIDDNGTLRIRHKGSQKYIISNGNWSRCLMELLIKMNTYFWLHLEDGLTEFEVPSYGIKNKVTYEEAFKILDW